MLLRQKKKIKCTDVRIYTYKIFKTVNFLKSICADISSYHERASKILMINYLSIKISFINYLIISKIFGEFINIVIKKIKKKSFYLLLKTFFVNVRKVL